MQSLLWAVHRLAPLRWHPQTCTEGLQLSRACQQILVSFVKSAIHRSTHFCCEDSLSLSQNWYRGPHLFSACGVDRACTASSATSALGMLLFSSFRNSSSRPSTSCLLPPCKDKKGLLPMPIRNAHDERPDAFSLCSSRQPFGFEARINFLQGMCSKKSHSPLSRHEHER